MPAATSLVWMYVWSVFLAVPITWAWPKFLFWRLNKRVPPEPSTERIEWIPMLVGIFERAIVTSLMLWAPKLTAPFLGGWMALKVAGGWGLLKEPTTRNRATFFIGLLGNVVSFAWAIGVVAYFSPQSIQALNDVP